MQKLGFFKLGFFKLVYPKNNYLSYCKTHWICLPLKNHQNKRPNYSQLKPKLAYTPRNRLQRREYNAMSEVNPELSAK